MKGSIPYLREIVIGVGFILIGIILLSHVAYKRIRNNPDIMKRIRSYQNNNRNRNQINEYELTQKFRIEQSEKLYLSKRGIFEFKYDNEVEIRTDKSKMLSHRRMPADENVLDSDVIAWKNKVHGPMPIMRSKRHIKSVRSLKISPKLAESSQQLIKKDIYYQKTKLHIKKNRINGYKRIEKQQIKNIQR